MARTQDIANLEQFLARLNQGDLDSIRQNIARDFFGYAPKAGEPTGADAFHEVLSDIKGAFSDFNVKAENLRAEGELIRGQLTLTGTHDGALWNAPASGNCITWTVDAAARPSEGKFAITLENVAVPDMLGVLRQIDLVPPPDQMDKPPKYPVAIPEIVLKVVFNGQAGDKPCSHLSADHIQVTEPTTDVCQDCVALGDIWPALRMCLTCGYVGCCDTSKNKHMKQHSQQTGHPLFRSIRLEESWMWCYEDNAFFSGRVLDQYR